MIGRQADLVRHLIGIQEWREETDLLKVVGEKERLWCSGCKKYCSDLIPEEDMSQYALLYSYFGIRP